MATPAEAIRAEMFGTCPVPQSQYDQAGLNARHIVAMALSALGREIAQQPARA